MGCPVVLAVHIAFIYRYLTRKSLVVKGVLLALASNNSIEVKTFFQSTS